MIALTCQLTGLEETLRRLSEVQRAALSGSAETREAMRLIGLSELASQHNEFLARSSGQAAGGFGWKRLSPLTVLLRRGGASRKLPGWAALVALADVAPILIDTGRLAASLAPGSAGNVLEPGGLSVTVGTNVAYASLQHEGGASAEAPIDSPETADRAASRILKVMPGHKPADTPKGRPSHAKKNWNPEFFRIRGWLRKLVGRTFQIPARPILSAPPPDRLAGYAERVKDAIARVFQ